VQRKATELGAQAHLRGAPAHERSDLALRECGFGSVTCSGKQPSWVRRRASAEARPTSEAKWVGPQRRSPEHPSAQEDAARRSLPEAKRGKGPERGARTERTINTARVWA